MNTLIPSLAFCLATSIVGASFTGAETFDTQIDYSTNASIIASPAIGVWSYLTQTHATPSVCDAGSPQWDSGSGTYVLNATFSVGCTYIYYSLNNLPHALDGSTALTANFKVEVLSGQLSDAIVSLGYAADYLGFGGPNGQVTRPYNYDFSAGGWQTVGGDFTAFVAALSGNLTNTFALSTRADLLPQATVGPVLLLNNKFDGARALTLRVTIKSLEVQHSGIAWASYPAAVSTAQTNYLARINPILTALNQNIQNAKNSVDTAKSLIQTSYPALYSQINSDEADAVSSHSNIVNTASSRTDTATKVPTQDQYDKDLTNLDALNGLSNTANFAANSGLQFLYYPWEATGRMRLNELSSGVPSTPLQTSQTTLTLNQLEPVSVVLQNMLGQAITVNQVAVGTFTNQFGETFPASHIDTRVVKSWYTGSATHIDVRSTDVKVRVPELLLKDDSLVRVNDAPTVKSNELHVVTNNQLQYVDISSPSALMPNDAVVHDAATLQPFPVGAMNSKQLWFTLDTRTNVRPGNYSGTIAVSYLIAGDTSTHTLQIPMGFTVVPVQLQSSELLYSTYYRGQINSTGSWLSSEYKSQQQYSAEMNDMVAHGVRYPTQYIGASVSTITSELNNYVSLRSQAGMPCDKYFLVDGLADIGTNASTAGSNATLLIGALQSSSCPNAQLYMYGQDEAQGNALNSEISAMQSVHNAGGKTFVAGYLGTYSHIGGVLDTLVFSGTPEDGEIGLWRQPSVGKDVYSYANPQAGIPDPSIYRSHYGFLLRQHNYTGAMDYAYQDSLRPTDSGCSTSAGYCSPWNNFANSSYYNNLFTLPTTDGVIDTVQWEGFREGVDDTRYYATLKALVLNSSNSTLVSAINSWLAGSIENAQANLDPIATRQQIQSYFQQLNLPPVVSGVSVSVNGSTISAAGQASDPEGYLGSVTIGLDNNSATSLGNASSWQTSYANVADGTHTVTITATDYWGATSSQQSTVTVDTQSPGC